MNLDYQTSMKLHSPLFPFSFLFEKLEKLKKKKQQH